MRICRCQKARTERRLYRSNSCGPESDQNAFASNSRSLALDAAITDSVVTHKTLRDDDESFWNDTPIGQIAALEHGEKVVLLEVEMFSFHIFDAPFRRPSQFHNRRAVMLHARTPAERAQSFEMTKSAIFMNIGNELFIRQPNAAERLKSCERRIDVRLHRSSRAGAKVKEARVHCGVKMGSSVYSIKRSSGHPSVILPCVFTSRNFRAVAVLQSIAKGRQAAREELEARRINIHSEISKFDFPVLAARPRSPRKFCLIGTFVPSMAETPEFVTHGGLPRINMRPFCPARTVSQSHKKKS